MAALPKTIDAYLATLNDAQRTALEQLRQRIRAAAPDAEECISYRLAAFRQNGMLVAFGATPNHCAFYPMSSTAVRDHETELQGYDVSKGTIRFPPEKPLPAALVRKLVKARIAENAARRGIPLKSRAPQASSRGRASGTDRGKRSARAASRSDTRRSDT
ncbi:MAG TPA: DUF1801 domain-containing protein [Planctomycetota bacterium]|nr:DUF1801 domain-containing protein [Planctomycetota bacterium]